MDVQKIGQGLWRWTAPHPGWKPENDKPGGWGRMVGCVYAEPGAEPGQGQSTHPGVILIDPLAPPEGSSESGQFWAALDADVARVGLPVIILLGNEYHSRSIQLIHDRYAARPGASVLGPEAARAVKGCRLTASFSGDERPRHGFVPYPVPALSAAEVIYYLPGHRALVVADALLGAGSGRLRVAPPSWAPETEPGATRYAREFRTCLKGLLELDFDRVLVSHGPPVLERGREALAAALEAPAWGEEPS